ncbi:MAG TPA: hypothetical protein VGX28_07435 [Frankiaceae bacterium]|nr:hypothetical protein [Frankiaceae bacterium]
MRADLLALDEESLAALANRGIVKRSVREVGAGLGPTVTETEGTVRGDFADGTAVALPPGVTLGRAACSCGTTAICRHRVMTVLAYQASQGAAAELVAWSPGAFADADVEALVGARLMATARKLHRAGYRARVRRPTAEDPVPTVELPSCAVRFLVPHELGYARVDAAQGTRADAVALAVWAFRAADDEAPDLASVDLMVGGEPAKAAARGTGVEAALPLLDEVLADGVAHLGPGIDTLAQQARRALDGHNARWPVDALDDLVEQLAAYRDRSAGYSAEQAALAAAEIVARHRCVAGNGASLRSDVLGTEEAAETPLRLLRMTGLGARVTGDDGTRTVEVYLAHPEAGVVLTLRRRVAVKEGEEPPTAGDLARRKAGGARLSALAAGNVVTESAVRAANRLVRFAEGRLATTSVTPSAGAWGALPPGILVDDVEAEAARITGLPPSVVRPRLVAEQLRVVPVAEVAGVGWRAGEQRLVAELRTASGSLALDLPHTAAAPGAVDAAAAALANGPRFVAGHLRRRSGALVVEPTALVVGDRVVVPAFGSGGAVALGAGAAPDPDPLAAAVAAGLALTADVLHRGWRHLPPSWGARAGRTARDLQGVGLSRAAEAVEDLVRAASAGTDVTERWADAHLRLLVTSEQL